MAILHVLTTVLYILIGILALSVLVVVHELGHYTAGRLLGFRVVEFAVGFGPKLFKFTKSGIDYTFRAFPLGGFCRFYGEDEDVQEPGAMNAMPKWKRLIVLVSGAVANIIFAFIIGVTLFTTVGAFGQSVATFLPNSKAEQAGLMPGDYFYSVNGRVINGVNEDASLLISKATGPMQIVVVRDGQKKEFTVSKNSEGLIGITIGPGHYRMNFFQSIARMWQYFVAIAVAVYEFFARLFTLNLDVRQAAGPVTMIKMMGDASRGGIDLLAYICILISVNLGIFNLIPFPALDGGRILVLGVEAVRKKPIPREKEAMIHFAGFVALILLVVVIQIANFTVPELWR